jgi:hypothetical protein
MKFKKVFKRDDAGRLNMRDLPTACKECQAKLEARMRMAPR